jgi:hypothetical protein
MKVAVILPSRGLIFSATAEDILDNLRNTPHKFFFSHGQPIPKCFESPTRQALKDKSITHLWFVEDDMILPPNTLQDMLALDANAVTCDYPTNKDGRGSVFTDRGGSVVFCGTGCLLVRRTVFDGLKRPYFTDRVRWNMLNYGDAVKLTASPATKLDGYGLHDITFGIKLWKNGVIIKTMPVTVGQRKLISLGKAGSNDGAHTIEEWTEVVPDMRLEAIEAQPVALGAKSKLVVVDTPTGGISTSRKHADNLVKQGLASYPPKRHTIIDDSDVVI